MADKTVYVGQEAGLIKHSEGWADKTVYVGQEAGLLKQCI